MTIQPQQQQQPTKQRTITLPPEILTDILTASLSRPPTCALSLLCPEWHLCTRRGGRHARLEALLRKTRVDTYTLPLDPSSKSGGTVTTTFDHPAEEHRLFCLPVMDDPRSLASTGEGNGNNLLGAVPGESQGYYQRELVSRWVGGSVFVVGQEVNDNSVGPLWRGDMRKGEVDGMVLLREKRAVGLLPFEDDVFEFSRGAGEGRVVFGVEGDEKERLPPRSCLRAGLRGGNDDEGEPEYLFQRLRHLVVNCDPALTEVGVEGLGMLPSTWGPEVERNVAWLGERLEYERRANLRMRWDAMERLESLFLDLRGYTVTWNRFLELEDVLHLTRKLNGKNLALLVIAGLRSGPLYQGPDPLRIEDVEGGVWDAQDKVWATSRTGRGINWWLMFRDAVRPGGRLVFVDRLDGNPLRLLRPPAPHWVPQGY